jgi:hypothetical protein
MAVEDLELVRLKTRYAKQRVVTVSREAFVHAAAMRAIRVAAIHISDDVHYPRIRVVVERWLKSTGADAAQVDFDSAQLGDEIGQIIVDAARKQPVRYQPTGRPQAVNLAAFSIDMIRSSQSDGQVPIVSLSDLSIATAASFTPGMVVRGFDGHTWTHALHPAYSFDSVHELQLAWLVDHSDEVDWWFRNQPRRFRIPTPTGEYSPDFFVRLRDGSDLIVEVKGSIYWQAPESDSRIKARAAAAWADAQCALGDRTTSYCVLLDSDVERAESFAEAIERRSLP